MPIERFNVVLTGATLSGAPPAIVAPELAKLIRRDANFAARLLSGQPTTIKSGVDAATGARYIGALEHIGVAARLEPEALEIDSDIALPERGRNGDPVSGSSSIPGNYTPAKPPATVSTEKSAVRSEGLSRAKRLRSLPNLAFLSLAVLAALVLATQEPYGATLSYRFGELLGLCAVPFVLGLAWNCTAKESRVLKWLYVGSMALFLLMFVGSEIQKSKEQATQETGAPNVTALGAGAQVPDTEEARAKWNENYNTVTQATQKAHAACKQASLYPDNPRYKECVMARLQSILRTTCVTDGDHIACAGYQY